MKLKRNSRILAAFLSLTAIFVGFQNFDYTQPSTSSKDDCSHLSPALCDAKNARLAIEELELKLPALDLEVVKKLPLNRRTFVVSNIGQPAKGGFEINGAIYDMNHFIDNRTDASTNLNFTQTFYPLYQELPQEFDYFDSSTHEAVLRNSSRKIVIRYGDVVSFVTTRDNKLFKIEKNGPVTLLAQDINPFTLSAYSETVMISDTSNRISKLTAQGLEYLMTLPKQLENPILTIQKGSQYRFCSLNFNRDYFCTGLFNHENKLSSQTIQSKETKADYSTAFRVAENVCKVNFDFGYALSLSKDSLTLFTCNGSTLQMGERSVFKCSNNCATEKTNYSQVATKFKGQQKIVFAPVNLGTPLVLTPKKDAIPAVMSKLE